MKRCDRSFGLSFVFILAMITVCIRDEYTKLLKVFSLRPLCPWDPTKGKTPLAFYFMISIIVQWCRMNSVINTGRHFLSMSLAINQPDKSTRTGNYSLSPSLSPPHIIVTTLSLYHTHTHVLFFSVSFGRVSNPLKMLFKQPFVIPRVAGMALGNAEESRYKEEERKLQSKKRL